MRAQALAHASHPAVTYAAGSAEHIPLLRAVPVFEHMSAEVAEAGFDRGRASLTRRRPALRDQRAARLPALVVIIRGGPVGAGRWWAIIHSCLTMSTEISTAGIVPLFSSQWVVFRSSGQPAPGP